MVRRIVLCLVVMAGAVQGAGIDFTPEPYAVQLEGVQVEQPGFRNGTAIVTFSPPAGWTYEGAGPILRLTPKNATLTQARVESRALPGIDVASEETMKSCQQELLALLPREAEGLKWEDPEANPIELNRHATMRWEMSYSAYGQAFRATIIVCNLADQQLRFVLSTRDRDYEKLYSAFRRSLYTWQGLK